MEEEEGEGKKRYRRRYEGVREEGREGAEGEGKGGGERGRDGVDSYLSIVRLARNTSHCLTRYLPHTVCTRYLPRHSLLHTEHTTHTYIASRYTLPLTLHIPSTDIHTFHHST